MPLIAGRQYAPDPALTQRRRQREPLGRCRRVEDGAGCGAMVGWKRHRQTEERAAAGGLWAGAARLLDQLAESIGYRL